MQNTKPHILYLDQDAEEGFAVSSLLELADYQPVTTNFASDAFQLAQRDVFDLYLLRFPVNEGLNLCRRFREIAPETPIVFLSDATGDTDSQLSIRTAGCVGTSNAPRDILDAVRRALPDSKNDSSAVAS